MLVTEEYRKLLNKTHEKRTWGNTAPLYLKPIVRVAEETNNTIILDYGCGHGSLRKALEERFGDKYTVIEYDPGIEGNEYNNVPTNFVVCIDVLEHIEPDLIDDVLLDIKRCMLQIGVFTVCTRPAFRILQDGRNAHLIVEPESWWEEKISKYFTIFYKKISAQGDPLYIVKPLAR